MKKKLSNLLKYTLMLFVAALLLWLSFESIETEGDTSKIQYLLNILAITKMPFLLLSGVMAVLSHAVRAERWKLLLNPIGYKVKLSEGFATVMTGYFINLAVPRGGEFSRCYYLYKLNKTPIEVTLGTVVAERVVDLLFLVSLIVISFFAELDNLLVFFRSEQVEALRSQTGSSSYLLLIAALVIAVVGIYLTFRFLLAKQKYKVLRFLIKSRAILLGLKDGIRSVLKLEKRGLFIVYSVLIWVCYYLMMYSMMLAFSETSELGFGAALSLFVIGGIAMAIPLPGGAGSFHVLVSTALVLLYGLPQDKAVAFTFIFHGWQTLVIIVVGLLSLIGIQIAINRVGHRQ